MISSYLRAFVLSTVLLVGVSGFAGEASAATTCSPHLKDFTPYVYSDGFNSFDVFYDGGVPVVLETTVAGRVLEPRYTSIWKGSTGSKVHVDVPTWYGFSGTVPVRITVASLDGCLETKQFEVALPVATVSPETTNSYGSTGTAPHVSAPRPTQTSAVIEPITSVVIEKPAETPENVPAEKYASSTEPVVATCVKPATLSWQGVRPTPLSHVVERREIGFGKFAPVARLSGNTAEYTDGASDGKAYVYRVVRLNADGTVAVSDPTPCYTPETVVVTPTTTSGFVTACSSWGSSFWGFLVALHLAAAVITISYLQSLIAGNGWRFTAALFVPFAAMLGLWFVFDGCRISQWFPISVSLITLIALIIGPAFGDSEEEKTPDVTTHVSF